MAEVDLRRLVQLMENGVVKESTMVRAARTMPEWTALGECELDALLR